MSLQDDKNKILNEFYEHHYYPQMRRGGPICIELIVSPKCNLGCKYCYVKDFYHKTFPVNIFDPDITLKNTECIIKALTKKNLAPTIDLFSGELFAQEIGYKILDLLYSYYKELPLELRPEFILVPTNYTFICENKLVEQIGKYIEIFDDIHIKLRLSASIDGKYMETNRPFRHNLDIPLNIIRDDDYYTKIMEFNKKYNLSLHPMVYSENISEWIKNFDWIQEQYEKYGYDWRDLYLLEVRNANWSDQELKEYRKFLKHIFFYAWEKFQHSNGRMLEWLLPQNKYPYPHGFNILGSSFYDTDWGITCSIQSSIMVRVADLMIVPCHRTMYEHLQLGQYVIDDDYNLSIIAKNTELALTIPGIDKRSFPRCIDCEINQLCAGQCLGAMYENTGDPFIAIPTVCKLYKTKSEELVKLLDEVDVYDDLLTKLPNNMALQVQNLHKRVKGE